MNPTSVWNLGNLLGKGSFGSVFLVKNSTGQTYAAKICEVKSREEFNDLMNEVEILSRCNHQNVLRAVDSYYYEKKVWMILELCDGGSLDDVIEKMDGLDEITTQAVIYQSMKGLEYLHENGVIHRDIKAGNIMLTDSGILKLADFGVSAILQSSRDRRNTFIGTPYWMAPEAVAVDAMPDASYDFKVDVWSMGITVLECLEVLPPSSEYSPVQVLLAILKNPPPTPKEPEKWSPQLNDFLLKTLIKDPQRRPNASTCLAHPWLSNSEVKKTDKVLELYKLSIALDNDAGIEVLPEEELDSRVELDLDESTDDKFDSGKGTYGSFMVDMIKPPKAPENANKQPITTKTIRKTVKCEVNGVTRVKTVVKVIGENNKGDRERQKSMQSQILKQLKLLNIEHQREKKKIQTVQHQQLSDLISKNTAEFDNLIEKYRTESESANKTIAKEVSKKELQLKSEIEKYVKKVKSQSEKERKMIMKAAKSKDVLKFDSKYKDPNYIKTFTENMQEDVNKYAQKLKESLIQLQITLVTTKKDQLLSLLKCVLVTRVKQTLEIAQLRRSHICANLEHEIQHKLKVDLKEQQISIKYMQDKQEQLKQQYERRMKDMPKQNRVLLKREMDIFKKSLRSQKVKNEKELINQKQDELINKLKSELEMTKQTYENQLKKIEEDDVQQLNEARAYQDNKSKALHKTYQEQLYRRFIEDEKLFKVVIHELYKFKCSKDEDFEREIASAKATNISFNVSLTQ